jgi:nucleoside-diphosphate-sugar epimerase/predicted dehydrogenase
VDTNLARAKDLVRRYGQGRATRDYKEAISAVDAAIVALPNYLHARVSIDFLMHGRDVLCEKPIATTSSDALAMINACEKSGSALAMNFVRRRYGNYETARSILDTGLLGRVTGIQCEEGRIFSWQLASSFPLNRDEAGGGVLMDWGSHILDSLRWVSGGDVEVVSYEDDSLGGVEANCNLVLNLRTRTAEIPCSIVLSRTRSLTNNFVVRGSSASMRIHDSDTDSLYLRIADGPERTVSCGNKGLSDTDYFAQQVAAFLDRSIDCSAIDGLKTLGIVEDCYRKRRPLSYPWEYRTNSTLDSTSRCNYTKILVVGASGMLGTRLVERLVASLDLKIRATVHRPQNAARLARLPVELVECDILNAQQVANVVKGCDIVVNCTRETSSDANRIFEVSAQGTANLLQAATEHGVRRFIHVSTASVHGFGRGTEMVRETSGFVHTLDPYVRGKIKAERLVMAYHSRLPVIIFRPTLIYGPYSSDWTIMIIRRIRDHLTTIIGDKGLANIVYVDDVVDAIIHSIMHSDIAAQAFILNNDLERVMWSEYVERYAQGLGLEPRVRSEFNLTAQNARNLLSMLGDSASATWRLLTSLEFLALLTRIPILVKLGLLIMRGERRKKIEEELSSVAQLSKPDPKIMLKYDSVSKGLYRIFTSQALFSAEKARTLLSWRPRCFEEGIEKTLEWARWAGLLVPTDKK